MSSGTNKKPAAFKFEWDFDVPDMPFWKGMELTFLRNFLTCFQPEEVDNIHFDATLYVQNRLRLLLSWLQSRLYAGEATAALQGLQCY